MGDRSPEQSKINALKHDIFDMHRFVGIPDFTPTHTLHVKFGNSESGIECGSGNELPLESTVNPPSHIWWDGPAHSDDESFTLIELDLDAPSKTKGWMLSPILHYLVVNIDFIPTPEIAWPNVLDKAVLVRNYLKPGPPPGSGLHRYVFILCRQPKLYDIKEVDALRKLGKFKLNWSDIMQQYKLQPIALDFFLCQNPNSCIIS
eukprot:Phypoly_transcript_18278.p1 GENE.Phypoly_transcript_18278~~Phypoly_transcript_18278.p1  ORF type:complete len:204 (+),score=24.76 Phypoly_transcript_18278:133-744(+)